VAAPKEVEFVPDKHGVPKGARLKSSKAQALQQTANGVASHTVAQLQAIEQRQSQQLAELITSLGAGLQAVIAAVQAPKSVQLDAGRTVAFGRHSESAVMARRIVHRRIVRPDAPALGPVLTISSSELRVMLDRRATGRRASPPTNSTAATTARRGFV
jgi:hypothetical protein